MKIPEKFQIENNIIIEDTKMNCFIVPYKGRDLEVIASINPSGWEQVSVSLKNRNPNWEEMCYIKSLFFDPEEVCIQFHPRSSVYINIHNHCLHIWKPPIEVTNLLDKDK